MAELDLDARRAEHAKEAHKVTIGGVTYELPPRFPLIVAEYLANGEVSEAVGVLFGEEAVEEVAPALGTDDLDAILTDLYDLGDEKRAAAERKNSVRQLRKK